MPYGAQERSGSHIALQRGGQGTRRPPDGQREQTLEWACTPFCLTRRRYKGISANRNAYKFQQYFREVHTITQHAFTSARRYESSGARMLGMESEWGFFAFSASRIPSAPARFLRTPVDT